jgi:hypothetical protein
MGELWLQQVIRHCKADHRLALVTRAHKKQVSVWLPPPSWARLTVKELMLYHETLEDVDREMRPCAGAFYLLSSCKKLRLFLEEQAIHWLVSDDAFLLQAAASCTYRNFCVTPPIDT